MKRPSTPLGQGNAVVAGPWQQVKLEIGVVLDGKGQPVGCIKLSRGAIELACHFDADRCDELSVDFRTMALELRNGGQVG